MATYLWASVDVVAGLVLGAVKHGLGDGCAAG